mgnify:CR=1 FL=1
MEAPDECGHRNEPENKVRAIELIDEKVLAILLEGLEKYDDYKIMILPDHPTPIVTKTHARDAVPYMIYHKNAPVEGVETINEETAKATGNFIEKGSELTAKVNDAIKTLFENGKIAELATKYGFENVVQLVEVIE